MRNKKYNVILKGRDQEGKVFVKRHGDRFNIKSICSNFSYHKLITVESIRDQTTTLVNVERDKNYRIKFN